MKKTMVKYESIGDDLFEDGDYKSAERSYDRAAGEAATLSFQSESGVTITDFRRIMQKHSDIVAKLAAKKEDTDLYADLDPEVADLAKKIAKYYPKHTTAWHKAYAVYTHLCDIREADDKAVLAAQDMCEYVNTHSMVSPGPIYRDSITAAKAHAAEHQKLVGAAYNAWQQIDNDERR